MAGKRGMRWKDPRPRFTLPPTHSDEEVADPANGETVPRCGSCGHPGPLELVGRWGGLSGRFPLCEACWRHFNPPDPLRVDDAA
jgi:hypothetical protein